MPASENIKRQDLADALNAMEAACIARDAYEQEQCDNAPPMTPCDYIPCAPFFASLLSKIEVWWANEEQRKYRKDRIADMYVLIQQFLDKKELIERSFKLQGEQVPPEFYTTRKDLQNVSLGSFDDVFNASGLWDAIVSRGASYYANDNASDLVDDDDNTYLVGDDAREEGRVFAEETRLSLELQKHAQTIANQGETFTKEYLLEIDQDFNREYYKY